MSTNLKKERNQRLKNKSKKTLLKTVKEKFLNLVKTDEVKAKEYLSTLQSTIDSISAENIIHKNKGRRIISQMSNRLSKPSLI